ncbi:DNA mismatch repair protein MutS [Ottowia sp.]|uniref:MutS-related protein n=1 Tax=Ottowia sp. TaxID=1898956 RepID=UPI002B5B83AE|nr:DNA mismatch repair protein MutS [Ottowia sp.]HNR82261.1 DNA mismatch repair protein MutS [Ottowia sp.]HNU10651.1 DNA mismatch repair protein MutS [Rubrivivax sp.]
MDAAASSTLPPAREVDRGLDKAIPFESILGEGASVHTAEQPDCFHDLGLDQIVEAVVSPWKDYDLAGFFHASLSSEDAIVYRQEVMRDLEQPDIMAVVRGFTDRLVGMRQQLPLATKSYNERERNRWHLGAVQRYGEAITTLSQELTSLLLRSRGLRRWREYIERYSQSSSFTRLMEQAAWLERDLAAITYTVTIEGADVSVRRYADEPDYTAEIEQTFAKFRRGAVKDYLAKLPVTVGLNHIEAQVLDCVARLNPEVFGALSIFRQEHQVFVDPQVERFDREIHFYIGWLDFIAPFKRAGLAFDYPDVSNATKDIEVHSGFDLALGRRLLGEQQSIVCNDFNLHGEERMIVVTGPNQGGKTTFARMFGQLHWLACIGCSVPAAQAQLFLFDRMFSHFEREEDIRNLRGKLHDDLVRMHHILAQTTPRSIVVINEIFSSTTLEDALYLGDEVLKRLAQLDAITVCVTFLDELASFSPSVVSMVAAIDPVDPTARSFRLERRPADGLAHALAIAEKYHVTGDWLKKRIPP